MTEPAMFTNQCFPLRQLTSNQLTHHLSLLLFFVISCSPKTLFKWIIKFYSDQQRKLNDEKLDEWRRVCQNKQIVGMPPSSAVPPQFILTVTEADDSAAETDVPGNERGCNTSDGVPRSPASNVSDLSSILFDLIDNDPTPADQSSEDEFVSEEMADHSSDESYKELTIGSDSDRSVGKVKNPKNARRSTRNKKSPPCGTHGSVNKERNTRTTSVTSEQRHSISALGCSETSGTETDGSEHNSGRDMPQGMLISTVQCTRQTHQMQSHRTWRQI